MTGSTRWRQAYTLSSGAWGARAPGQHELPTAYHGIRSFADFRMRTAAGGVAPGGRLHTAVLRSRIHPALDGC